MCLDCGKRFAQKSMLLIHQCIHAGESHLRWTTEETKMMLSAIARNPGVKVLMGSTSAANRKYWKAVQEHLCSQGHKRSMAQIIAKWKRVKAQFFSLGIKAALGQLTIKDAPQYYSQVRSIWLLAGKPTFGERKWPVDIRRIGPAEGEEEKEEEEEVREEKLEKEDVREEKLEKEDVREEKDEEVKAEPPEREEGEEPQSQPEQQHGLPPSNPCRPFCATPLPHPPTEAEWPASQLQPVHEIPCEFTPGHPEPVLTTKQTSSPQKVNFASADVDDNDDDTAVPPAALSASDNDDPAGVAGASASSASSPQSCRSCGGLEGFKKEIMNYLDAMNKKLERIEDTVAALRHNAVPEIPEKFLEEMAASLQAACPNLSLVPPSAVALPVSRDCC
ncbi:neurofilament medium polypeptide-like [Elgaria multicarinata webbii]|uniref:neurofilament medium polypeptide-like n=1 Tax=Elgaria multicarinata webbii TaxID=159646 RepID=UPI002FCD6308